MKRGKDVYRKARRAKRALGRLMDIVDSALSRMSPDERAKAIDGGLKIFAEGKAARKVTA